jgi:hypothetical protein
MHTSNQISDRCLASTMNDFIQDVHLLLILAFLLLTSVLVIWTRPNTADEQACIYKHVLLPNLRASPMKAEGMFASLPPLATSKVRQPQTKGCYLVARLVMWPPQFLRGLFRDGCGSQNTRHKVWHGLRCGGMLWPATKQPLITT